MSVQKVSGSKKTANTSNVQKPAPKKTKVQVHFASNPVQKTAPKLTGISDVSKGIIDSITKHLGLKFYSKELVKDDTKMIEKSQKHLLGLVKYYEGDPENYYEGKGIYKDKYNKKTKGFGCTKAFVTIKTQEQAYTQLEKDLFDAANSAKNKIDNRLGKGTYDKLPLSIKEALIDLSFNKGPDKVVKPGLFEAIKMNDYSAIVGNLYYVHSGEKKNGTEEDPGLYRRSLSRAILAARDLSGKEKTEANAEIDKLYARAKRCFAKNNKSTSDLENIYSFYKTGHFVVKNSESLTMTVDSAFKGKGGWSIARAAYQAQDTSKMSFQEFYEKFTKLNSKDTLENIKVGDVIKLPLIEPSAVNNNKLIENINKIAAADSTRNIQAENSGTETKTEQKKPNFLTRIGRWFKSKFNAVGRWIKGVFSSSKNETPTVAGSEAFQKVIKDGNAKEIGELTLFTKDYVVKNGDDYKDTVYRIAKEFDTSVDIIKSDNDLDDKCTIHENQILTIQKLGYKIKDKETLSAIAQKFGLTLEILKDINGIEDTDNVQSGQVLEIPGFSYTVKSGDTLSQIAKKVGVTVDHLRTVNGLKTDMIHPGDHIIIIFNNADYAVPESQKKVTVDKTTKTVTETIDMTSRIEGIGNRELLKTKQRENGKVVATRKVFSLSAEAKKKLKHPLPLEGKTIIVNAGHGYSEAPNPDVGALSHGRDGVEDEWLCNYDNAMKLKDKLVAQGAKVIFIQGAVNTAANEIVRGRNKADMFISVHVNSFDGNTKDRTQIYYTSSKPRVGTAVNKKSKQLAEIMEKNFDNWIPKHEKIGAKDKFVDKGKQDYAQAKSEGLLVCNKAEASHNIPSVLWEVAFMGSHKGRQRLKDDKLMNNYASVMAYSVTEYFKQKS